MKHVDNTLYNYARNLFLIPLQLPKNDNNIYNSVRKYLLIIMYFEKIIFIKHLIITQEICRNTPKCHK